MASNNVKIAVFAPMPSASVSVAVSANPGCLRRVLAAKRRSLAASMSQAGMAPAYSRQLPAASFQPAASRQLPALTDSAASREAGGRWLVAVRSSLAPMRSHINLLGMLHLVWGGMGLLLGVSLLLLAVGAARDRAGRRLSLLTAVVAALLFVLFAAALAVNGWANAWAGRAIRQHRPRGRMAALLLSVAERVRPAVRHGAGDLRLLGPAPSRRPRDLFEPVGATPDSHGRRMRSGRLPASAPTSRRPRAISWDS